MKSLKSGRKKADQRGGQRREVSFVLKHPLWTISQMMWYSCQYRLCIPGQELEMLAVSKGKALLHLAFLSIIDPCSSHCRWMAREENHLVLQPRSSLGQDQHGSLSSSMLLPSV